MKLKTFDYLPEGAIALRTEIFVKEQGFQMEFDETDHIATHIVCYEEDVPVATCRVFYDKTRESHIIGRVAVKKEYRGLHLGAHMLAAAEAYICSLGGTTVLLSAQLRIASFYEKQGFFKKGDCYLDEGCPHIWMVKSLEG